MKETDICTFFILFNNAVHQSFAIHGRQSSRIQSIPLNQNTFQNNSGRKIHKGLHYTLKDIFDSIQVANK
jgi:hypothetical protein